MLISPEDFQKLFDERERKEIEFARIYASGFHHGTDGHHRLMLIDKLFGLLDVNLALLKTSTEYYKKENK